MSFKALSDATAKFSDSCSQDDLEGLWNAWLMLTGLDDIRRGTNQAEYKREYIQFHAVMINAFGYAVQRLSEGRGVRGVTLMIEDLVMNTGIAEREDFSSFHLGMEFVPAVRKPGQRSLRMYLFKRRLQHV